jgi:hypothetical protein
MNNSIKELLNLRKKLGKIIRRKAFSADCISGKPKVIVNSFPKSGTHLLGRLVENLGFINLPVMLLDDNYTDFRLKGDWDKWEPIENSSVREYGNPLRIFEPTEVSINRLRSGQFFTSHLKYTDSIARTINRQKIKHLFIIRDIRDCICSWTNWVMDLKSHNHMPELYFYLHALCSEEDRIMTVIEGKDRFLKSYKYHLDYGRDWIVNKNVFITRYEDIIGPKGGGKIEKQKYEIKRIAQFLEIDLSLEEVENQAKILWGGRSRTMKFGQSKYWEKMFTSKAIEAFDKHYSGYMKMLGYGEPEK